MNHQPTHLHTQNMHSFTQNTRCTKNLHLRHFQLNKGEADKQRLPSFFLRFIFNRVYVYISVWLPLRKCRCLMRPAGGIRSPGAGMIGSWKPATLSSMLSWPGHLSSPSPSFVAAYLKFRRRQRAFDASRVSIFRSECLKRFNSVSTFRCWSEFYSLDWTDLIHWYFIAVFWWCSIRAPKTWTRSTYNSTLPSWQSRYAK